MKRWIGLGIWLVAAIVTSLILSSWYDAPEPINRPDWGFWPLCWLIGSIFMAFLMGFLKTFIDNNIDDSGTYAVLTIVFWPLMLPLVIFIGLWKLGKWSNDQ